MSSSQPPKEQLLAGLRIVESSVLLPGFASTFLADLGAEVIKVEPPGGDYIRQMTWPIIDEVSLLHLHTNRGKKSIVLDLKTEEDVQTYKKLVATADIVLEGMRPGSLARLGLGYEDLRKVNPRIVFATLSGYGATGPYRDLPSHGIAFDAWSGIVAPRIDDEGFARIPPEMPNVGINVGPMLTALAMLAGVYRAKETGEGCEIEIAQSEAAAYLDWYRIETERAYQLPEDQVTGNPADDYERRPAGLAGMWEGVRYQAYAAKDGFVLFMASEREFWRNFCIGLDREDLFDRWPGEKFADHARNNVELQLELKEIFATRSVSDWMRFAREHDTTIAPFNTPETIAEDPQFQERMPFVPAERVGCEQLPLPITVNQSRLRSPGKAPEVDADREAVLASLRAPGRDGEDPANATRSGDES